MRQCESRRRIDETLLGLSTSPDLENRSSGVMSRVVGCGPGGRHFVLRVLGTPTVVSLIVPPIIRGVAVTDDSDELLNARAVLDSPRGRRYLPTLERPASRLEIPRFCGDTARAHADEVPAEPNRAGHLNASVTRPPLVRGAQVATGRPSVDL